jgi:mRNA interferase YafQ
VDIQQTTAFKKHVKLMKKRGCEMDELKEVIDLLVTGEPLPEKYKDHPLVGDWVGFRDCHIRPDWILIYQIVEDALILRATGTHADLFGK